MSRLLVSLANLVKIEALKYSYGAIVAECRGTLIVTGHDKPSISCRERAGLQ